MPLEIYDRDGKWWARGYVDYAGQRITGYIRESTGASTEAGANRWAQDRTDRECRRHVAGEDVVFTFADAVMMYPTKSASDARRLIPLTKELGHLPVRSISPMMIRDLGPKLYPDACADTWRRAVIGPVRAVINNAHDAGKCGAIKVRGYADAERVAQDKRRGRESRIERVPGSWEWLLRFREQARPKLAALALYMFTTGARIGQAVSLDPDKHLDLQNGLIAVPGAKGHADRWLQVPMELIAEIANLPRLAPRGWLRRKGNFRVFGYADRGTPLKAWRTTCKRAGIAYLPPHSAGRHGFGQEFNIRQPVDEKAAGRFGGWSDTGLMRRTYTHSEDADAKIEGAWRTGLVQAEIETGIKLRKLNVVK